MIIYNAEVYSMTEDMHFYGYVEIQDGKITAVEQGKPILLQNPILMHRAVCCFPALLMHIHILALLKTASTLRAMTATKFPTRLPLSSELSTASIPMTDASPKPVRTASLLFLSPPEAPTPAEAKCS